MEAASAHCRSSRISTRGWLWATAWNTRAAWSKRKAWEGAATRRSSAPCTRATQDVLSGSSCACSRSTAPGSSASITAGPACNTAWSVSGAMACRRRACSRLSAPAATRSSTWPVSKCNISTNGRYGIAHPGVGVTGAPGHDQVGMGCHGPVGELAQEHGLAAARLAHDKANPSLATQRPAEPLLQLGQLLLASHKEGTWRLR